MSMNDLTRGERLQIMLTREEVEALDNWRFTKRMPSRAAAIRELLKRGLAAEGFDQVAGPAANPRISALREIPAFCQRATGRTPKLAGIGALGLAREPAPLIEGAALGRPGRTCRGGPETRPGLACPHKESKMSKMKTKSGAKKRFKFTANGKIKTHQVGKRHRLINNSPARTRDLRGMDVLSESETQRVKRWMPYGGGI